MGTPSTDDEGSRAHPFHQLLINEDLNAIYILSVAHQSLFWSSSFLHIKNTSISFKPKHTSILIWPSLLLHRAFTRCDSYYAMQGNPVHLHLIKRQWPISLLANEKQQTYSTLSAVRRGGWIIVGIHGGEVRRSPVRSFHTGEQGEHVHSMRGANALKRGFQASRLWSLVSQGVSGHMWVWASRSSVISHSDYLQLLPSSW